MSGGLPRLGLTPQQQWEADVAGYNQKAREQAYNDAAAQLGVDPAAVRQMMVDANFETNGLNQETTSYARRDITTGEAAKTAGAFAASIARKQRSADIKAGDVPLLADNADVISSQSAAADVQARRRKSTDAWTLW